MTQKREFEQPLNRCCSPSNSTGCSDLFKFNVSEILSHISCLFSGLGEGSSNCTKNIEFVNLRREKAMSQIHKFNNPDIVRTSGLSCPRRAQE